MSALPPPPFDPELEASLPEIHAAMPPAVTPEMISAMRELVDGTTQSAAALGADGRFQISELRADEGETAPPVDLLVARPARLDPALAAPILFYTHGGGMFLGSNRFGLEQFLDLADQLGFVVISPEYRLAPEHRFPAGIEDVYAGLLWVVEQAEAIGADGGEILLAGSSSGGGLTASLALLARDRGGPRARGQLLLYPMLDDRNNSDSSRQMAGLGVWDATSNATAWEALLGAAAGGEGTSAYAAAGRASDLSGLPPTFLEVGSAETFRDEVVEFASRIWRAGGEAELHVWPGAFHASDFWVPAAALSRDQVEARGRWVKRLLARQPALTVG